MFIHLMAGQYENFGYWRSWIHWLSPSGQIDGKWKEWGRILLIIKRIRIDMSKCLCFTNIFVFPGVGFLFFRLLLRIITSRAQRTTWRNGLVIQDLNLFVMVCLFNRSCWVDPLLENTFYFKDASVYSVQRRRKNEDSCVRVEIVYVVLYPHYLLK